MTQRFLDGEGIGAALGNFIGEGRPQSMQGVTGWDTGLLAPNGHMVRQALLGERLAVARLKDGPPLVRSRASSTS